MDEFDRKLLAALKVDSQARYVDLGATVHLSAPAVHERVKKMKRQGILRRFTVDVDPAGVGFGVCAYVSINLAPGGACSESYLWAEAFPEVEECHTIAGSADVLLKVRAATTKALELFLVELSHQPDVAATTTTMVLDTYLDRGVRVL